MHACSFRLCTPLRIVFFLCMLATFRSALPCASSSLVCFLFCYVISAWGNCFADQFACASHNKHPSQVLGAIFMMQSRGEGVAGRLQCPRAWTAGPMKTRPKRPMMMLRSVPSTPPTSCSSHSTSCRCHVAMRMRVRAWRCMRVRALCVCVLGHSVCALGTHTHTHTHAPICMCMSP